MNRFNFLQIGGYPLETDTLDGIQTAYALFNALGAIAGDKSIVSGCVVAGSTTGDGVVYVNGELFKFVGGNTQATVRIIETPTSKVFENGENKEVFFERIVTFASGAGAINWSEFIRINPILQIQKALVPVGMISMWSGSPIALPTGWKLCDGANGTPNLKGRFIVGYDPADVDYDAIGDAGGSKAVALTTGQLPAHSHTGNTDSAGAHTHNVNLKRGENDGGASGEDLRRISAAGIAVTVPTESNGAHSHSFTTANAGSGQSHENRPPYYTLAYIMYTGI